MRPTIRDLDRLIASLDGDARAAAERSIAVSVSDGRIVAPAEMAGWLAAAFGASDAADRQRIVRVTDLVRQEGALFNDLRARRPVEVARDAAEVARIVEQSRGDPFCHVETGTPADAFGRIRGAHSTTASNVAKADGHHGVLVFAEHDPLAPVPADVLADHLRTARAWADAAHRQDPEARYYLLLWNALWRAGGSIVHGHMQMTLGRGLHYPRVEALRQGAVAYRARHGADYFEDLWLVHERLGLGRTVAGARLFASLVPVKEREVIVLGRPGEDEIALASAVAHAIAALRRSGMLAHNLALWRPPIVPDGLDWSGFPPLVRIVDRGDPGSRTSDIGAMELYAASVISADPFRVAESLDG